jgi:integrase
MPILTETQARKIAPDSKKLADGTVKGLALWPSTVKGRGNWVLRYTSPVSGKRRYAGLGSYPDVSIAEARSRGTDSWKQIGQRLDPLDIKAARSVAQSNLPPTFEDAAKQVYEQIKPAWKNGKHVDQWLNTLDLYVFPKIGKRRVDTLDVDDFANVLRPIWLSHSETASRVKQRCEVIMTWCMAKKVVAGNPLQAVKHLLPKMKSKRQRVKHQPSLPYEEIPAFVRSVLRDGSKGTCRESMEFLILSGSRSGEVRNIRWSHIDIENRIWTCPAEFMKAKRPHRVPLSWRMLEILEEQKGKHQELVFPSPRGKVMSDATLSKFLKDHKIRSDEKDRLAVVHGFRSSLRTWGSDKGYSRDLMEKVLAHAEVNQLVKAYSRTDQLDQRRVVIDAWTDYVCGRSNSSAG